MDYSFYLENWMKLSWGLIKDTPLWRIIMPATHDSGSFSPGNTIWNRNQVSNIGDQLATGIRAFDIRARQNSKGEWIMYHDSSDPNPPIEQNLFDALRQLKEFAEKHPHEMIIINLRSIYRSTDTTPDGPYETLLQDYFAYHIGHLLIKTDPSDDPLSNSTHFTPAHLKNAGSRNILVVAALSTHHDPAKEELFWKGSDRNHNSYWRGSYGCYQGDAHTPKEKVDWLGPQVKGWLQGINASSNDSCQYNRFVGKYFNSADLNIWTLSIINDNIDWIHPKVVDWCNDWIKDSIVRRNINLIALDGVNKDKEPIKEIITKITALNGKKSELGNSLIPLYSWVGENKEGLLYFYSLTLDNYIPKDYQTFLGPIGLVYSPSFSPVPSDMIPIYIQAADGPFRVRFTTTSGSRNGWNDKGLCFYAYNTSGGDRVGIYEYHATFGGGTKYMYTPYNNQYSGWSGDRKHPVFYVDNMW